MSISQASGAAQALLRKNNIDTGKIKNFEGFVAIFTKLGQQDPLGVAQYAYNNMLTAEQKGQLENRMACLKATAIVTAFIFATLVVIGILTATRSMPPTFAGLVMAAGAGIVLILASLAVWSANRYYKDLQATIAEKRDASSTTATGGETDDVADEE